MSSAAHPQRDATRRPLVAGARSPALRVVELACRAPSVRNSQPWAWRVDGTTIELHADWDLLTSSTDPTGRQLLISCGAALHHAQVAARGLGWRPVVSRWVDGAPDLSRRHERLARLDLFPSEATPESAADLTALLQRRTDRRRFTSWPVPEEHLRALCASARSRGSLALPIHDPVDRVRVGHLLSRARRLSRTDPPNPGSPVSWAGPVPTEDLSDGLVLLCSRADDPAAWTTVGESLGALWLSAVRRGLAAVPLSGVVEVAETREGLRGSVLGDLALPQLLVRVGWQTIAAKGVPRSERRALADVLLPRDVPGTASQDPASGPSSHPTGHKVP